MKQPHPIAPLVARELLSPGAPFRAPHFTTSYAGLIGAALDVREGLNPSEVELAAGGILFLDDLPEFRWEVVSQITLACQHHAVQVVATWQSCPCGEREGRCVCRQDAINLYRSHLRDFLAALEPVLHPAHFADPLRGTPRSESEERFADYQRRAKAYALRRYAARFDPNDVELVDRCTEYAGDDGAWVYLRCWVPENEVPYTVTPEPEEVAR